MNTNVIPLMIAMGLSAVVACDLDVDNNDSRSDGDATLECSQVCERLDECALEGSEDFNASACTDGCESEAESSDNFEADVEECRDCIGREFGLGTDDTCATDFTVCGNECANVTFQSN